RLPTLGAGDVAAAEASGSDLWITADGASYPDGFRPRWLGAHVALADAGDAELGVFRVLEIDAAGRARLEGAAAHAATASGFAGRYRFDDVTLLNNASLDADDPVSSVNLELAGPAVFDGEITVETLHLRSGAVITPASGQELRITATQSIQVDAGALVDVSGRGYGGSPAVGENGLAPAGVEPAGQKVGGAHGGIGRSGDGHSPRSEVYDSVYFPRLAGSGGGWHSSHLGSAGGGVIVLEAPTVVLDGELRARGINVSQDRGTGAGGTVVVQAGTLSGTGSINVSGGDSSFYDAGYGGGGRVAVYASTPPAGTRRR
ncbi:MAG: hypothetical protein AAFX50_04070, partial [Acidobacteriota bacterium]